MDYFLLFPSTVTSKTACCLKTLWFYFEVVTIEATGFHACCRYENNTLPCRWRVMFRQALHKASGGWGCLTPSQQCFAAFAANGSTIALSPGSLYLATACQCACFPPALLSLPKQKGWLITPSCCMPITYYYSCFVHKKGQEKSSGGCQEMFVDSAHLLKIYALDYLKTRKRCHRASKLSRKPVCLVSDVWQLPSPTWHASSIVSAHSGKAQKFGLVRRGGSLLC